MFQTGLLSLLLLFQVTAQSQLTERISDFWNALETGDKYSALELVTPESRNAFINRTEIPFRGWELAKVEEQAENRAKVTLSVGRLFQRSKQPYPTPVIQEWVYDGEEWRVEIPQVSLKEVQDLLYGIRKRKQDSGNSVADLKILPKVVKMQFLNPVQTGRIIIRNGSELPVEVLEIDVDEERFEIRENPGKVLPGERGRIMLVYQGDELEKELEAEAILVLKRGEEVSRFQIPILYNHISQTTRKFLGLTEEEVRHLKPGEPVQPVLKAP